jgi:hypothetical protein
MGMGARVLFVPRTFYSAARNIRIAKRKQQFLIAHQQFFNAHH